MRIISFSKKWDKLSLVEFTTFRFPRGDRDWYVGEVVQVFFKNRSPQREKLGEAEISDKVAKDLYIGNPHYRQITDEEARGDGFASRGDMLSWLYRTHGRRRFLAEGHINKLTLRWVSK